jgi:photosystem II stability/assembly factor-like uncharacterized protein
MKHFFLFLFFIVFVLQGFSQNSPRSKFTPYDELPSVEKILKPEFSDDMPDWGKMLYQYPVNFNDINTAFARWEIANKGIKNPLIRYYKLWRRHMEPFVDYDGTIVLPDPDEITGNLRKAQSVEQQRMKAPSNENTSAWTFWGPKQTFWLNESGSTTAPKAAPWQVNVYSMDVSEANPDVIYVGTETSFVNKSTDRGKTWQLLGLRYVFGGGVSAIAVHPTNPDTVYVAAGNTVHRSFDGGVTWGRTSASFYANRMKLDPVRPSRIVASTNYGVYISENRGISWTRKSTVESWDVEFKPGSSDTIFALTQATGNMFRIIQSTDDGASFSEISSFPTDIPQVAGGLLAVTPKNPNIMYAVFLSKDAANTNLPYIYKGTYANNEWTWVKRATGKSTALQMDNGQGYFDLVLEVSPVNENMVYAGTTTLFKSVNGGSSFYAIGGYYGSFSIHPDIQDMKILSNGDTWVTTDGGMNLSKDNFNLQSNFFPLIDGLIGSDMWGFDQGWNEDIIVGGRYHNGNTAIADFYGNKALRMGGAESPTGWLLKGKSRHAAFDDLGDGWILPKTAEGRPEGRFIFSKYPNMDQYGALRSNVVTHPNYSGTLYLGSENSIWVTTNYGQAFDLLYTFPGRVRYLDISRSNPQVIYADIEGSTNGLFRSLDGGKTWGRRMQMDSWNGKMTFAISPYNYNVIYAARQVGAWDNYDSEMYKSTNGGATWSLYSSMGRSVKSIVIQPTREGKDLVYAITSSVRGNPGSVLVRKDGESTWRNFDNGYPVGMRPVSAAIFFRDSKLRVAGNGGVWESPLAEPVFTPILTPWVDKAVYSCTEDTVYFDDHSMINHTGVSWKWEITPAPRYISDPNIRNPKAVFTNPGKYSVKMTVTTPDSTYSVTMDEFFEITSCPSIDDCTNPAEVPQNAWKLVFADSYMSGNEPAKAFDGNTSTIWHTSWGTNEPQPPHEIQVDMGESYLLSQFIYYPRTDGSNGRIKEYELYVSDNKTNWGTAVATGTWENSAAPKTVKFTPAPGRYFRLRALSEVNGNAWSSAAELKVVGCRVVSSVEDINWVSDLKAYPVPATTQLNVQLPFNDGINPYTYELIAVNGARVVQGVTTAGDCMLQIDLSDIANGYYLVKLTDHRGIVYRSRFLRQ